jgi:hypothetical protein
VSLRREPDVKLVDEGAERRKQQEWQLISRTVGCHGLMIA